MAHGQDASTDTVSVPLPMQIEISNLGKDTRNLLQGRYTQTGLPKFLNGIKFGDGTTQTTAASSTNASSSTFVYGNISITQASFMTCINSTVTFTTRAVKVELELNGGTLDNDNASAVSQISVLVDGARIDALADLDAALNTNVQPGASTNNRTPSNFHYRTMSALTAGSHSFCITGKVDAGLVHFNCTKGGGTRECKFTVSEAP